MDRRDTTAIGRRAALMAFAGSALLSTSGCYAIQAIIARLHGDDSFDEGGDGADKKGDKGNLQGKRSEQRKESQSNPAASQGSDTSSDEEAFGE